MNTVEIEKAVEKDKYLKGKFLGVFSSDKLPAVCHRPSCFIANTDPSDKPGEHWVALYFDKRVEYFDSYGLEPLPEFRQYKPDWFNKYCIQGLDTAVCGEHCVYFLHNRACGLDAESIVRRLVRRNDADRVVKLHVDKLRTRITNSECQCCKIRGKQ